MKKFLKITLSVITMLLLFSPFFMPEKWIYIQKQESVYDPTWESLAKISVFILAIFVVVGIDHFYDKLIKE